MLTLPDLEKTEEFKSIPLADQTIIRNKYKQDPSLNWSGIVESDEFSNLSPDEQESVANRYDEKYNSNVGLNFIQKVNQKNDGDFWGGVKQGVHQTEGMIGGAVGLIGDAVGYDKLRDFGFKVFKDEEREAQKHASRINRIEDIEGFGDAVDWFQGMVGSQVPILASTAFSGGVGGAVAKKALSRAATKAVEKKVASGVARNIATKEVAKSIVGLGRKTGLVATTAAFEGGGMWGDDASKNGADKANAGSAAALALVSGLSELGSPVGLLSSGVFKAAASPTRGLVKRVAKGAAKDAIQEGGQEVFQEMLSIGNEILNDPNQTRSDFFNEDHVSALLNSGVAGVALGGFTGGITSIKVAPNEEITNAETVDDAIDGFKNAVTSPTKAQNIEEFNKHIQTATANDVDTLLANFGEIEGNSPELAKAIKGSLLARKQELDNSVDILEPSTTDPAFGERELLNDIIDSHVNAQDQADVTARRRGFEQLKGEQQHNQEGLSKNTTGRPSTAQQSAEVFVGSTTPTMEAADARAQKQEDLDRAFQEDLTPPIIKPGIDKIIQQLDEKDNAGKITDGAGNDSQVIGGYGSTAPEWLKQKTLKKADKKNGTNYAKIISDKSVRVVTNKLRSGKKLTPKQSRVYEYVKTVAKDLQANDVGLVAGQEIDTLQKEGFEFDKPVNVSVGNLSPGDEVVIEKDGIPDKLTHKGFDKKGNAILEDGVTLHVDPFEQIEVIAQKKESPITEQEKDNISNLLAQMSEGSEEDLSRIEKEISPFFEQNPHLEPYKTVIQNAIQSRRAEFKQQDTGPKHSKHPEVASEAKKSSEITQFDPLALLSATTDKEIAKATGITLEDFIKRQDLEKRNYQEKKGEQQKRILNIDERIKEAERRIDQNRDYIEDWSSREYKKSDKTYQGFDMYGQDAGARSVSGANERRRVGRIQGFNDDITRQNELIDEYKTLKRQAEKKIAKYDYEISSLTEKDRVSQKEGRSRYDLDFEKFLLEDTSKQPEVVSETKKSVSKKQSLPNEATVPDIESTRPIADLALTEEEAKTLSYLENSKHRTIPNEKTKPVYDSLVEKGLAETDGKSYAVSREEPQVKKTEPVKQQNDIERDVVEKKLVSSKQDKPQSSEQKTSSPKSKPPEDMTKDELLSAFVENNGYFQKGGLSAVEFDRRNELDSSIRKAWFGKFGKEDIHEASKEFTPKRPIAEIEKEIEAIKKKLNKLHAKYSKDQHDGSVTRRKTTTYNANASGLAEQLDLLKVELREQHQEFQSIKGDGVGGNKEITYEPSVRYDTIKEGGNTYEIPTDKTKMDRNGNESAAVSEPVQTTMFSPKGEVVLGGTKAKAKLLESHPVKIGSFRLDVEKVESAADAAQVLSPLGKRAQETFLALVLDANDKPISILQHSVGGPISNQVFLPQLVGSIHNLKGAKSVWIAHNHPSSSMNESSADTRLTRKINNALKGAGIDLRGHLIMTPAGRVAVLDSDGIKRRQKTLIFTEKSKGDKGSVKVTERRLRGGEPELLSEDSINSRADANKAIKEYGKGQNGMLLLDTQHRPIRFVAISIADMQKLRSGKKGAASSLYRLLDKKNNAVAAILNFSRESEAQVSAERNMAKFGKAIGLNMLDSFVGWQSSLEFQSIKTDVNDVFFSKATGKVDNKSSKVDNEILPKQDQSNVAEELSEAIGKPTLNRLLRKDLLEIVSSAQAKKVLENIKTPFFSLNHRFYKESSPMSDWGHAMFAEDRDNVEFYGETHYTIDPKETDNNVVNSRDDKFVKELRKMYLSEGRSILEDVMEHSGYEKLTEEDALDKLIDEADPDDIVDSAGLWDSSDITLIWEHVLEPNGWDVVVTSNGAVVFNEDLILKQKHDINYSTDGKRIEGFTAKDPATGKTKSWIVEENIEKGEAHKLLLHEVASHLMLEGKFQGKQWDAIEETFNRLENKDNSTGKAIREARARIPSDTKEEHIGRELVAYYIGNTANRKQTLYRRIMAYVKEKLVELGFSARMFTPADIEVIAKRSLSRAYDPSKARKTEALFSKAQTKPQKYLDAAKKITDTAAFKKWFGNSKIRSNGEPHILYHGTNDPDFLQNQSYPWVFDTERQVNPGSSPLAGLGIFLGNDTIAGAHSVGTPGTIHPFFVKVENPLVISSEELETKIKDPDTAKAFRKRAKELNGHDGIIIKDRGQVIVFEPNQLKSASENTGEFSTTNNDVRYSVGSSLSDVATRYRDIMKDVDYKPIADSGFLSKLFSSPEYTFRKAKAAWRVFQVQEGRMDEKIQLENEIFNTVIKEDGTKTGFLQTLLEGKKKHSAAYKKANDYILKIDYTGKTFTVKQEEEERWSVVNKDGKTVATFDNDKEASKSMMDHEGQELRSKGFGEKSIAYVREYREMTNRAFDLMISDIRKIIAQAKELGLEEPTATVLDENGKSKDLKLSELIAVMSDLRGSYFARQRSRGSYILRAEKDGEKIMRKFDFYMVGDKQIDAVTGKAIKRAPVAWMKKFFNFSTSFIPGSLAHEMIKLKREGYTIAQVEKDNAMPETVFESSKLVASMSALLDEAKNKAEKEGIDKKAVQEANKILTGMLADIVKQRGYMASRMKRSSDYWKGFEEDMLLSGTQYGRGLAAGIAKKKAAQKFISVVTGRDIPFEKWKEDHPEGDYEGYLQFVDKRKLDPTKQPVLYADTMSFIKEMLRNEERVDRVLGTLKGIAVVKFLGFRVSSAAVNATNMVQAVPAVISSATGGKIADALVEVGKSASTYYKFKRGKNISTSDRTVLLEIINRGWDEAQFNKESVEVLQGKLGRGWNELTEFSMKMFGAVEKVNRATTILAAYNQFKANNDSGMSHEEMLLAARQASNDAHGLYGKATRPVWTRGAWNPLQLAFVFAKFSQNYSMKMLEMGLKGDTKQAAYMLLSPAILAGSGASLATPVLMALAGALGIGGDDPEEEFYKWMEDSFGSGEFARHGLAGLAGVNLKGSIQMNNPMPTNLSELFGAPGAIFTDLGKGVKHIKAGEYYKGAESILPTGIGTAVKAIREGSEGITTGSYSPVYYGDEPLKADGLDTTLRFLGFNPARISGIREKQWHEKVAKRKYQERRNEINTKIKRYFIFHKGSLPEIYKEIQRYNELVRGSGRRDLSPINPRKQFKTIIRRAGRANKTERLRNL